MGLRQILGNPGGFQGKTGPFLPDTPPEISDAPPLNFQEKP